MSRLKDLKVGDKVFVVWQRDRYQQRNNTPHKTAVELITMVGRKYAYIKQGSFDTPFDKSTGVSQHDPNQNARQNGFGFDVYHTESDWMKEQHEYHEYKRLKLRLNVSDMHFIKLKPETVEQLHKVLDDAGVA